MDVEKLWAELKPKVNAVITERLVTFHDALVERRQIPPSPAPSDPEENGVGVKGKDEHDCAGSRKN